MRAGITLLILCSSPGGSYSNWWCSLFNADLALSVAMTTCSTFAAMLMLPINTLLYVKLAYGSDSSVELDWWALGARPQTRITFPALHIVRTCARRARRASPRPLQVARWR
jgi:hypothetical protein